MGGHHWKDEYACFTNLYRGKAHFGIDLLVEPDSYVFQFFERDDKRHAKDLAESMLRKMKCLNDYVCIKDRFIKKFTFPSQENELVKHIQAFNKKLAEVISAD